MGYARNTVGWGAGVCLLLCACGADEEAGHESTGEVETWSPQSDAGWSALTDWEALPVLGASVMAQTSSYQRDGAEDTLGVDPGNKDFSNFVAVCGDRAQIFVGGTDDGACDEGIDGYVIASADDGPGFVSRFLLSRGNVVGFDQSTLTTGFSGETLRVYVDDLTKPAFEGTLTDLENGGPAPFAPPLTWSESGTLVSYLPISYRSKLRVVLDDLRTDRGFFYFYQVDRRSATKTVSFDGRASARALPGAIARLEQGASGIHGTTSWTDVGSTTAAHDSAVVLDRTGPGTIRRLVLRADSSALDDLALTVTWDDAPEPAIDVTLAALFAESAGPAAFTTLPMSVELDGPSAVLTLTLPMPFAVHAHVAVENRGENTQVVHTHVDGVNHVPSAPWGYLHAVRNERQKPSSGERYGVVDVRGRGKYVGTAVRFIGRTRPDSFIPSPFNFLEGDDVAVVDDVTVRHGTGTEESFDGGWYFMNGTFSAPFSAAVFVGPGPDAGTGQIAAVRWQVAGAVDFQRSFSLSYEYGADTPETGVDYSSVAFYYAK